MKTPAGSVDEELSRIGALTRHDLGGAEQQVLELIDRNGDCAGAHYLLGQIRLRCNAFQAAVDACSRALELDPGIKGAAAHLARGQLFLGDMRKTIAAYDKAMECEPSFYNATMIGCCRHRVGDAEAAIAAYRQGLALVPGDHRFTAFILFCLMRALRDARRFRAADRAAGDIMRFVTRQPRTAPYGLVLHSNEMDFYKWDRIRKKEGLHAAICEFRNDAGNEAFPSCPETFVMPQDFDALAEASAGESPIWIVKPLMLFGGQGIRLTESLSDIPREDGYVVQRYIANPCLVGGKKSHIRLYMLISSVNPLRIYLFRDGIVRFAPEPYRRAAGWLDRPGIHITNTALHVDHPDLVLSDDPDEEASGNIWSLSAFLDHLGREGASVSSLWSRFEDLATRLALVIRHTGLFREQARQPMPHAYPPKLLGMDVLLDETLQPWLMEIQRTPATGGRGAVVKKVNNRVFTTIARMSAVQLLGRSDTGVNPEWLVADRSARALTESALEYARRGDFVRPLPPEPAAPRRR